MTRPFRFAVQDGPFDDPSALVEHARNVERLGYAELYSFDHIGAVDPFAPLVAAALATDRLRVGPLVINNELHHPVLLARTVATVDRVTGGRLVLGIGTGYDESEHESIGQPIRPVGERVTRFGESLTVLRALLDSGAVSHVGEHLTVHVDDLGTTPVQERLPILVGGHGRRVVALAARHADIFQFTGLVHGEGGKPTAGGFAIEQVRQRAAWLSESAGERDADIERSILVQFTHVGDDAPSAGDLSERFSVDAEVVSGTPFALFGSREQVVDELERLRGDIGVSHVVVRDPEGFAPVVEALSGR